MEVAKLKEKNTGIASVYRSNQQQSQASEKVNTSESEPVDIDTASYQTYSRKTTTTLQKIMDNELVVVTGESGCFREGVRYFGGKSQPLATDGNKYTFFPMNQNKTINAFESEEKRKRRISLNSCVTKLSCGASNSAVVEDEMQDVDGMFSSCPKKSRLLSG